MFSHCSSPACRWPLRRSARFCPRCGAPVGMVLPTSNPKLGPERPNADEVPPPLRSGDLIGEAFEVERGLGHGKGGMGRVYLVRSLINLDKRYVAKELIDPPGADPAATLARFRREAKLLARLEHEGIPGSHAFLAEPGRYLVVMDRANGVTLDDCLFKFWREYKQGLPHLEVVRWASQICSILAYLHKQGLVHLDLKPANFVLVQEGRVKLIDFGITNRVHSDAGPLFYTEGYASPERLKGEVSPLCDIFALGATLYYLLSGRPPKKSWDNPPLVGAPRALDSLVTVMMQLDPALRPASALQVRRELQAAFPRLDVYEDVDPRVESLVRRHAVEPVLCVVCGEERRDDADFCAGCGIRIVGERERYEIAGRLAVVTVSLCPRYWLRARVERIQLLDQVDETVDDEVAVTLSDGGDGKYLLVLAEVPQLQGRSDPVEVEAWLFHMVRAGGKTVTAPVEPSGAGPALERLRQVMGRSIREEGER